MRVRVEHREHLQCEVNFTVAKLSNLLYWHRFEGLPWLLKKAGRRKTLRYEKGLEPNQRQSSDGVPSCAPVTTSGESVGSCNEWVERSIIVVIQKRRPLSRSLRCWFSVLAVGDVFTKADHTEKISVRLLMLFMWHLLPRRDHQDNNRRSVASLPS